MTSDHMITDRLTDQSHTATKKTISQKKSVIVIILVRPIV